MKAIRMTASWCQPCAGLKKQLEQHNINIEAVDIDENTEMAVKYGIRGVPTILFLADDGTEAASRIVGAHLTAQQLKTLKELSL